MKKMKKLLKNEKTKENLKIWGAAIGGMLAASFIHLEFIIAAVVVIIALMATKKLNSKLRVAVMLLVTILVMVASIAFHSDFCLRKNEVNDVPQITEIITEEDTAEESTPIEDQPEAEVSTSKRLRLFNCFRERSNCRLKR